MYKGTHQNAQARVDRIRLRDIPAGPVMLTPEQRRDHLKSCIHNIEKQMASATSKETRAMLGAEKIRLQNEISAVNGLISRYPHRDMGEYILKIIKAKVSHFEWRRLCDEAAAMVEENEKNRKEGIAALMGGER